MSTNKIYKIIKAEGYFKNLKANNEEILDVIDQCLEGKSISSIWKKNYTMSWEKDEEYTQNADILFYIGLVPVINENSYNLLKKYIPLDSVEYLNIKIENNQNLYLMNVLNINTEIFNEKKSKIDYYKTGTIREVIKYVFNDIETIPVIFRIPQSPCEIFVSDEFVKIVKDNNLTGIDFKECKISRSLFNFKF